MARINPLLPSAFAVIPLVLPLAWAPASAGSPAPATPPAPAVAWQSRLVTVGADGRLSYASDAARNRIPDFSWAGYRNGEQPPAVAAVTTVGPVRGDATAALQAAVDAVGRRPRDASGFRGAVQLRPGTYEVRGTVRLDRDGVVLRGTDDGADPARDTVIRAVGNRPAHRDVVVAGGSGGTGWRGEVPGTRTAVTSPFVQVGSRSFTVADPGRVRVGANIVIVHPSTQAWLRAVRYGDAAPSPGWKPGELDIVYNRYVTAVQGDTVTVDAPVYNNLDRSLSPSYLYTWNRAGLVRQVGVENLRIDIASRGGTDEAHADTPLRFRGLEDGWARRVTVRGFIKFGVVTAEATRVTVVDSRAVDPVSAVTGGRRYNFGAEEYSQLVLFRDLYANKARHAYVSNGAASSSGLVFHRVRAEGSLSPSEGHRRWSQGLLFDKFEDRTPRGFVLGLYNRGRWGTSHGWGSAHSVVWNSTGSVLVQQPPTAQNYAIGVNGRVTGTGPFRGGIGYVEGTGQAGLTPDSLYEAQLRDRLRAP
jgi:hypothetical protein